MLIFFSKHFRNLHYLAWWWKCWLVTPIVESLQLKTSFKCSFGTFLSHSWRGTTEIWNFKSLSKIQTESARTHLIILSRHKICKVSLRLLDLGIQKNSSLNGPVECGITTLVVRMSMKTMMMLLIMMMTLIAFQILYSVTFSHTHYTEDYNS